MDSYYGPVKIRVDTSTDNFTKARVLDANGPATEGKYAISLNGFLGIMLNPENFTPASINQRKRNRRGWDYDNYLEKTKIFNFADKLDDFKDFLKDDRGLERGGWLYNNVIDEEVNRQQGRCEPLDVFILTIWQAISAADDRVEYVEALNISDDMLSKRFWVFPQGDAQQHLSIPSPAFQLTVNTLEGKDGTPSSFSTFSEAIAADLDGFLDQIRELLRDSEGGSDIWWTTTDIEKHPENGHRTKHALPGDEFNGADFLPWLGLAEQTAKRQIWVGSTGSDHSRPVRPAVKYKEKENGHWWVTIIDSATGQSYVHDSMGRRASSSKAAKLVENVNWLLKTGPQSAPAAAKEIANIRTSRAAPVMPISLPIICKTQQQSNSSDCGLYAIGNITGFVDALERLKDQGRSNDNVCTKDLIPKGWSASKLRKRLRNIERPVS